MASAVQMSRSRGSGSGLALALLGAWGGLAPFVGPYFRLGYEPDQSWHYTTGRLILVIVPGGVALLAGLIIMASRSRWFGGFCALLAALAGLWFVLGRATMTFVGTRTSASYVSGLLVPIAHSPRAMLLTEVATFSGVGVLMVFFAALALGRVSIGAYKDFLRFGDAAAGAVGTAEIGGLASVGLAPASPSYTPYQATTASSFDPFSPIGGSSFSPAEEPPVVGGQVKFPSQYPAAQGAGEEPDSPDQYGAATNTYTPGQVTYSPGQTQYPAAAEQTNPQTAPTEEQKFPPAQR